ncbi:restriction endonuclease subunit S [Wenyingzhuangia sp. IMCC45533]
MKSNLVQNIEALKLLPNNWDVIDFKNLVSDNSGGNKKINKSKFLKKGTIAIVDQGKEMIAGYYNDESVIVKTKPPYIIFGDHTRVFKFIDFPFVMGADGTKVLQSKREDCNVKYLYYFFKSINVPNTGYNRHFKYLKELKIPLPPIEEQQRIAQILDTAAELRDKTKAVLQQYDALARSIFLDMFGMNDGELIELGEVIKLVGGGTPSKANDSYWNGDIPWASVKDLKSDVLIKTQDTISLLGVENSSTRIISKGSLIVSTRMAVGKAVIAGIDVAINQDLKGVKIIGEINVHYLFHLFKSKLSHFESVSTGATVKGIKIEHITKLKVSLPNITKQNQFAKKTANIEQQKKLVQQELQEAENLFNCLLQKAFKGEL